VPLDQSGGGTSLPAIALPRGGVLTLDLASVVGWAYAPVTYLVPWFGRWFLVPSADSGLPPVNFEGLRYAAFENALIPFLERTRPSALILESALPIQAMAEHSSQGIANQQLGLRAIALKEAYRYACPVSSIDTRTVRREVLGQAFFPPKQVKKIIVSACYRRGWRVPDHNAGDACMVWEWHRMRMMGIPPLAGPLWREAVA